jgi:ABC-type lipoprotein release transport system permease subunit
VKAAFGLDVWRSSVFVFEKIPNELCWDSVLWMVPAAVCACVIGALVPAIIAARVQPVKILRYE